MAARSANESLPATCLNISPKTTDRRIGGFDALRAFAAILVVMIHAATPYLLAPVPGLLWPTTDRASSRWIDGAFWMVKGFVMPLFLFVAGYFAAGMISRMQIGPFLRHRVRRVLWPLAVATVTILPLDLYVWIFGLVSGGHLPAAKLLHPKFEANIATEAAIDAQFWGLSHLWFLQYLFLYCMLLAVFYASTRGVSRLASSLFGLTSSRFAQATGRMTSATLLSALVAASAAALWVAPEVVIGFQHGFLPFMWKFVYSGFFFFGGALLSVNRRGLEGMVRAYRLSLFAAAALSLATIPLIRRHLAAELTGDARIVLAVSLAAFAWLSVVGLAGYFLAAWSRPRPIVRETAEASFWIYLFHHPLVGFLHVMCSGLSIHVGWKFLAVWGTSLAVSMVLYRMAVRGTWIGAVLNGRSRPPIDAAVPAIVEPPAEAKPDGQLDWPAGLAEPVRQAA